MSMKNSNDTIGNRTRDLPACSAVPQSTAPRRAPIFSYVDLITCIQLQLSSNSVLMNIDSLKHVINFVMNRCFRTADTGQRSCSGQRRSACHTYMRRNLSHSFMLHRYSELTVSPLSLCVSFLNIIITYVSDYYYYYYYYYYYRNYFHHPIYVHVFRVHFLFSE